MGQAEADWQRERAEHRRETENYCNHLKALAHRLISAGGYAQAGHLLVLERIINDRDLDFTIAMGPEPEAEAEPAPKGAKKTGCASGRHSYADGAAACSRCGKVKSAGGRPRKEPAPEAAPTAETRTVPLPLVGDAAADRFAGGGLGSSGVRR